MEGDGGAVCPVYLGRALESWFTGWTMLERGILPHAGGWADQENTWTEAMDVIGAAVSAALKARPKTAE